MYIYCALVGTIKDSLLNYITVFRNRCILNGSCCRNSLFKLAKVNKQKHVLFQILCHDEDLHCVSTAKFVIRIANVFSDWTDFHMHVYWPKYHLYTTSWSQIICYKNCWCFLRLNWFPHACLLTKVSLVYNITKPDNLFEHPTPPILCAECSTVPPV